MTAIRLPIVLARRRLVHQEGVRIALDHPGYRVPFAVGRPTAASAACLDPSA
jgi:hypothetical protein